MPTETSTGLDTGIIDLYEAFPPDPEVQAIVDDAVAEADELGSQVLGQIEAPLYRARTATGIAGFLDGAQNPRLAMRWRTFSCGPLRTTVRRSR